MAQTSLLQILRERIADFQLHAVAVFCHQGTVSQITDLWATHSVIRVVLSPEQSIRAASSQPTQSISSSTKRAISCCVLHVATELCFVGML